MTEISLRQDRKIFTKTLIVTSLPVILQQLLQNSLSFIDTVMIGQLGSVEIAAVGLANQLYFLISVVIFGIASGAAIFTSQYWGCNDSENFQKTVGVSLTISLVIVSVFSIFSIFFPSVLMHLFVEDKRVVSSGCDYLRIVGISYLFVAVAMVFSTALRSSGDMVNPMKATLVSLVCNVIGNYVLIFPLKMGVKGAALATVFSRFIELAILYVLIKKSRININFKTAFSFKTDFVKQMLKTSFPVMLDDALWALGVTVYKAVYSRMGIDVLAAANVSESIQDLIFVVQNGMGAAISVMIGNEIGKGNEDKAQTMAKRSLVICLVSSLICAFILAAISPVIPKFFNVENNVKLIITSAMLALAATMPVKFNNHICVVGIIRSGGDTKFLLFTEMFSIWCVGVPLAILGGLVFKFDLWLVYLMIAGEEIAKISILIPRIFSGKWINNLTKNC